jgi:hypothetical protein
MPTSRAAHDTCNRLIQVRPGPSCMRRLDAPAWSGAISYAGGPSMVHGYVVQQRLSAFNSDNGRFLHWSKVSTWVLSALRLLSKWGRTLGLPELPSRPAAAILSAQLPQSRGSILTESGK